MAKATAKPAAAAAPAKAPGVKVAKVAEQTTALALPPDMQEMLLADAGKGLQNTKATDFALPFLYVLQALSPQVQERDAKYVEGAAAGNIMDTVNLTLWDSEKEPIEMIPVEFESVVNEWVPRDSGGGFVATHKDRASAEANQRDPKKGPETQLVDTANHYVLVKNPDGTWSEAVFTLTSTKLRASRKWLSLMRGVMLTRADKSRVPAPTYSRRYLVSTVPEQKDKHHFFNVKVMPIEGNDGWVADPVVYQMAKDFAAALAAGKRGADFSQTVDAEAVVEEDDEEEENY